MRYVYNLNVGAGKPVEDKCKTKDWPDNRLVCAPCKALIGGRFDTKYKTCTAFCSSIGRQCVGAWDDGKNNSCEVESEMTCETVVKSTSDNICECSEWIAYCPCRSIAHRIAFLYFLGFNSLLSSPKWTLIKFSVGFTSGTSCTLLHVHMRLSHNVDIGPGTDDSSSSTSPSPGTSPPPGDQFTLRLCCLQCGDFCIFSPSALLEVGFIITLIIC